MVQVEIGDPALDEGAGEKSAQRERQRAGVEAAEETGEESSRPVGSSAKRRVRKEGETIGAVDGESGEGRWSRPSISAPDSCGCWIGYGEDKV